MKSHPSWGDQFFIIPIGSTSLMLDLSMATMLMTGETGIKIQPWLVWLSGWSASLPTKGSLV